MITKSKDIFHLRFIERHLDLNAATLTRKGLVLNKKSTSDMNLNSVIIFQKLFDVTFVL